MVGTLRTVLPSATPTARVDVHDARRRVPDRGGAVEDPNREFPGRSFQATALDRTLLRGSYPNEEVAMRSLEYSVEMVGTRKAIAVLSLDGYVDSATSLNMDEAIDSILQQKVYHVVVDLTKVSYISSAGWGVFISKIKDIRENQGGLKIAGMRPDVRDVFDLLGFGHIIEAHDSVADAVSAFEAQVAREKREVTSPGRRSS